MADLICRLNSFRIVKLKLMDFYEVRYQVVFRVAEYAFIVKCVCNVATKVFKNYVSLYFCIKLIFNHFKKFLVHSFIEISEFDNFRRFE